MNINAGTIILISSILFTFGCRPLKEVSVQDKFKAESRFELPYRIYYPKKHKYKKLPVIIFLHGAGERGQDNSKQLVHVVPYLASDSIQKIYPSIILAPQCAEEDYWSPVKRFEWTFDERGQIKPSMQKLIKLVGELRQDDKVDSTKIYVVGLSMGGFGTYDLLQRKPEWFAAAVPMCGGGDTMKMDRYAQVPLWIFHGAKDDVVPPIQSRQIVDKLISRQIKPRYTEFPQGNHGIWEQAIRYPGLLSWLFEQKK